MIKNQSIRLWVLSILGVSVLALFWGMRSVHAGLELSRQTLAQSLDQELITLTSATTSSIQAMRWQMLDVTKAEVSEHQAHATDGKPTRTFSNSIFTALALLEWDQKEWKLNWLTITPAMQGVITSTSIKDRIPEWTMLASESLRFQRMDDFSGQPYFAALMPIVKGATRLMAVGIFQPAQFPLALSAARTREAKVVDDKGFALALSHPAYLGTSLRNQTFIKELIGQDELSLRQEFKNDQGKSVMAVGQRIPESNLYLTIEAPLPSTALWVLKSWLFLLFSGSIGVGLTWFFLRRYFNESFAQNFELAEQVESLKLQLRDQVERAAPPVAKEPEPVAKPVIIAKPTPATVVPAKLKPTAKAVQKRIDITPVEEDDADEIFFSAPFSIPKSVPAGMEFLDRPPQAPVEEKIDPRFRPLGKIILASIERIRKRHGTPDVTVETFGLEGLQSAGEESQLKTAIEEILKNAFEAVADSPQKTITVFAEKLDEYVRVSVTDTGPGIAPENLEKVFEPFYSTKPVNGVARGLGLNVVRRVSEDFNGRVRVFSEGRGTRVELEVPLDLSKGLPHLPSREETPDFQMLNLDFEDIENRQRKPLPPVNIRKPKVRVLD